MIALCIWTQQSKAEREREQGTWELVKAEGMLPLALGWPMTGQHSGLSVRPQAPCQRQHTTHSTLAISISAKETVGRRGGFGGVEQADGDMYKEEEPTVGTRLPGPGTTRGWKLRLRETLCNAPPFWSWQLQPHKYHQTVQFITEKPLSEHTSSPCPLARWWSSSGSPMHMAGGRISFLVSNKKRSSSHFCSQVRCSSGQFANPLIVEASSFRLDFVVCLYAYVAFNHDLSWHADPPLCGFVITCTWLWRYVHAACCSSKIQLIEQQHTTCNWNQSCYGLWICLQVAPFSSRLPP